MQRLDRAECQHRPIASLRGEYAILPRWGVRALRRSRGRNLDNALRNDFELAMSAFDRKVFGTIAEQVVAAGQKCGAGFDRQMVARAALPALERRKMHQIVADRHELGVGVPGLVRDFVFQGEAALAEYRSGWIRVELGFKKPRASARRLIQSAATR